MSVSNTDYLKCPHALAWGTTNLIFSVLEFGGAYRTAGQYDIAVATIKWALDWLVKAHVRAGSSPADNAFVGQVRQQPRVTDWGAGGAAGYGAARSMQRVLDTGGGRERREGGRKGPTCRRSVWPRWPELATQLRCCFSESAQKTIALAMTVCCRGELQLPTPQFSLCCCVCAVLCCTGVRQERPPVLWSS